MPSRPNAWTVISVCRVLLHNWLSIRSITCLLKLVCFHHSTLRQLVQHVPSQFSVSLCVGIQIFAKISSSSSCSSSYSVLADFYTQSYKHNMQLSQRSTTYAVGLHSVVESVSRQSRDVFWTSQSHLDTVTPMSRSRLCIGFVSFT